MYLRESCYSTQPDTISVLLYGELNSFIFLFSFSIWLNLKSILALSGNSSLADLSWWNLSVTFLNKIKWCRSALWSWSVCVDWGCLLWRSLMVMGNDSECLGENILLLFLHGFTNLADLTCSQFMENPLTCSFISFIQTSTERRKQFDHNTY